MTTTDAKIITYARFLRDCEYENYGINTVRKGKEYLIDGLDKISGDTYRMCIGMGNWIEFNIGTDVEIVKKLRFTGEIEIKDGML